jgi:hypothetical protein
VRGHEATRDPRSDRSVGTNSERGSLRRRIPRSALALIGPRSPSCGPISRRIRAYCGYRAGTLTQPSQPYLQHFLCGRRSHFRRLKIMVSWFQGDTAHKASVAADACPPKRPAASTTFSPAKSVAARAARRAVSKSPKMSPENQPESLTSFRATNRSPERQERTPCKCSRSAESCNAP